MSYTNGLDKPTDYFETILYTGNGSTLNVGGLDFTQDFTWIKNRGDGTSHFLYDTVRGAGNDKDLRSNSDGAEGSGDGATHGFMSAFRSDGFTVNQGSSTASITNASGNSFVSWNWIAGGSASSNTDGSITSSVSANTTAGFSIVSYTGTGSNATIGHGIDTPAMIMIKCRSRTEEWVVYNQGLGNTAAMHLHLTDAKNTSATFWQNTNPTSSVFSIGANDKHNKSGETFIAYCFAEKKGYSKFLSYTGNGNADGAFVYTGFRPAFVIRKKSNGAESWQMHDNKRDTFNVVYHRLLAEDSGSEYTSASNQLDFLSNGFKMRATNDGGNASGGTYIYMAFAESPFVSSTGIPTTAR